VRGHERHSGRSLGDLRERIHFHDIIITDDGIEQCEKVNPTPLYSCYAAIESHTGGESEIGNRTTWIREKTFRIRYNRLVLHTKLVLMYGDKEYDILDIERRPSAYQWMWVKAEART